MYEAKAKRVFRMFTGGDKLIGHFMHQDFNTLKEADKARMSITSDVNGEYSDYWDRIRNDTYILEIIETEVILDKY